MRPHPARPPTSIRDRIGWIAVLVTLGLSRAGVAQDRATLGPKDGAGLPPTDTARVAMGTRAPDFTLEARDGSRVTRQPEYVLLSDPGHRVIDRYGLLNPSGRGWPHPTVYVIDRQGMVRWKFTEVNYKIRPTNEMILAALKGVR